MSKDFYALLKKELVSFRGLFKGLRTALPPNRKKEMVESYSKIQRLAEKIGGVVEVVAKDLKNDLERLISGDLDLYEVHLLLNHVLKLEQEVREL